MKKIKCHIVEIIALTIQLYIFYLFPLFVGTKDIMGVVVIKLLSTTVVSAIISGFLDKKIKYVYPIIVAILFISSAYIYYNATILIHAIWYLIASSVGCVIGEIARRLLYINSTL